MDTNIESEEQLFKEWGSPIFRVGDFITGTDASIEKYYVTTNDAIMVVEFIGADEKYMDVRIIDHFTRTGVIETRHCVYNSSFYFKYAGIYSDKYISDFSKNIQNIYESLYQ